MSDGMQDKELDNLLSKANAAMQALHHLVVIKHWKRGKTLVSKSSLSSFMLIDVWIMTVKV